MEKQINDKIRLIVGVREWALETTIDVYGQSYDADKLIEAADKFENYVLQGVSKDELPRRTERDI